MAGPGARRRRDVFVILTAGEVPIIQVLQHFGLGATGAAALLITLPAVSLPSLAMLGRVLPPRSDLSGSGGGGRPMPARAEGRSNGRSE
ncbi:MAG: hypothetical protein ACREFJ_17530 [Acetobacteraceae bacterium]